MRTTSHPNRPRARTKAASIPAAALLLSALCLLSVFTALSAGCAKTKKVAEPAAVAAPSPAQPAQPANAANATKAAEATQAAPAADLKNVSPKAKAAYLQGRALAERKDWSGALAAFEAAAAEAPDMAPAFEGAGLAALESGRLGEAAGYFEKAAFLAPDRWPPHAYLAGIYRSQGRQELFAEECFAVISMAKGEQDEASAVIMRAHDAASRAASGGAPLRVEVGELTEAQAPATMPSATMPTMTMQSGRAQAESSTAAPKPGETRSGVMPMSETEPMPGSPQAQTTPAVADPEKRAEEERLAAARALMAQAEAQAQAQTEAKADAEAKALAQAQAEAEARAVEEARAAEEARMKAEKAAQTQAKRPAPVPDKTASETKTAEAPKSPKATKTAKAAKKGAAFTILESSWDSRDKAEARAEALRAQDIPARADTVSMNGRSDFFRVLIGEYASVGDAREAADALTARNGLSGLLPIRP